MSHVRDIVSAGEASTLLETEIKWLSDEEKQHMLVESGIAMDIKVSADKGLAIKAGLAIPWHKLRHLQRLSCTHSTAFFFYNCYHLHINLDGLRLQESPLLVKKRCGKSQER